MQLYPGTYFKTNVIVYTIPRNRFLAELEIFENSCSKKIHKCNTCNALTINGFHWISMDSGGARHLGTGTQEIVNFIEKDKVFKGYWQSGWPRGGMEMLGNACETNRNHPFWSISGSHFRVPATGRAAREALKS